MTLITSTWTGGTGRNVRWYNSAYWSQQAVPDESTVAVIPTGFLLNYGYGSAAPLTVAELDVAGTLDITGGGYLTVSIEDAADGASGLLVFDGGTVNFTGVGVGGTLELQGGTENSGTIGFGLTDSTLFWNTSTTISSNLTLDNFFVGDTLEVTASSWNGGYNYDPTTHVLTLGNDGTVSLAHSNNPSDPDYTTSDFTVTYNSTSGILTVTDSYPCFLRGTHIATLRGEVPVEALRIGDLVLTAGGSALPIRWIGTRNFITRLVGKHHRASLLPIRIVADALGEGCPARDLHVSPEHRLCLDDVLIPAEKLLNGTTITRAEEFDVVQYFHLELTRHAVLFAEGTPAESFLDTGNRNMFANVLSYLELGDDLDAPPQPACLPTVTEGKTLDAVRARLAERAGKLGMSTTEDDGVYLLVDGRAIRPDSRDEQSVHFTVPAGARQVRIVSRCVIPGDIDPTNSDGRCLGIPLTGVLLRDDASVLEFEAGYGGFVTGFYAPEPTHRWTNGDALLPEDLIAAMPDGFQLELKIARCGLRYPMPRVAEVITFRRSA